MANLVPGSQPAQAEADDIRNFAKEAKAPNTVRAYRADWHDFAAFLEKRNRSALPASPDDVALYLRHLVQQRQLSVATASRRLASVAEHHRLNGYASPAEEWVVRNTLRRLRTEHGAPARGKAPLLTTDLRRMMESVPETLVGVRDRAILLLGFAGAMRRSEIVALDVQDLAQAPEGLVVAITKSKTDQQRWGRKIGIPYGKVDATCPVKAILAWLAQSKISEGALFRSFTKHGHLRDLRLTDQIVADIVKRYAEAAGKQISRVSAHSLRAGFITSAAVAGVAERSIQDQSGHQSVTILRRYIRDACVFRGNAAGKVGL